MKRPPNKIKLMVESTDINFFHAFRTTSFHPYELY